VDGGVELVVLPVLGQRDDAQVADQVAVVVAVLDQVADVLVVDAVGGGADDGMLAAAVLVQVLQGLHLLVVTQTDRFHAARSFSRRRITGFS
jgi:hypothetical protein